MAALLLISIFLHIIYNNNYAVYNYVKERSHFSFFSLEEKIFLSQHVKPDHKNKKPRHVAENPWN
jgi:hypothetical protein